MVDYAPKTSQNNEGSASSAALKPSMTHIIVCFALALVCMVGCVSLLVFESNNKVQTEAIVANEQERIQNIEATYNELISKPVVTAQVVEESFNNANVAGSAIAEAQNYYIYAVTDENAVQVDVSNYVDDIHRATDPWVNYIIVPYTWTFCTTYDFADEKVDCVWLCKTNETGELIAYATSVYNAGAGKFEDIEVVKTGIINNYSQQITG